MNKKYFFLIFCLTLSFLLQISSGEKLFAHSISQEKEKKPEVVSLLGKKFYAIPAKGEELAKLQNDLKEALMKVEANPADPENIIMYGRRLAYLWRYHEAIEIYSKGIEKYPDYAMLFRHRGHRYISIRKFDKAVVDLTRASELNDHDFDIWYHLGLAHFLKGEFDEALRAYQSCMKVTEDDDAKLAISNWIYITLRQLGRKEDAGKVLAGITEGMEVDENQSYYDLLFMYKGLKSEKDMAAIAEASDLSMATIGYAVGAWYLYNGKENEARQYFKKIVQGKYWPAFGFIAAEAELFRLEK